MGTTLTETGILLEKVTRYIRRYVRLTDDQAYTTAAWTLHTWVYRQSTCTPYLAVMSPVKRSGKTTLLNCLANLTCEGEVLFDPTAASLFRMIDMAESGPTLLWDELDFTKPSRPIVAILNSGYKKGGAVPRAMTIEKVLVVKRFPTFCPKAFGSIGQVLPPTQLDRSIQIHLQRAMRSERVREYDEEEAHGRAAILAWELRCWANGYSRPKVHPRRPATLNARQKELWLPLLELAAKAGGEWTARIAGAARRLSAEADHVQPDETVNLLTDLRVALGTSDRVFSRNLIQTVQSLDEPAYSGSATTSMRMMAVFLSANFRVHPKQIRIGTRTGSGYYAADFADSFARYL